MIKSLSIIIIVCIFLNPCISISQPGSLDSSFGSYGKVISHIGNVKDEAYSVGVQPDGKILVCGVALGETGFDMALVRFNPDGSPDPGFGREGYVTSSLSTDNVAFDLALQPDGKILLAGYSLVNNNRDFCIVRFNPDGSPDSSFGENGFVTTDFGSINDNGRSIAIQADGKIIVAGFSFSESDWDFAMARYNPDGSLDDTFGTNGKIITAIGDGNDFCRALAIQADGKILMAGFSSNGTNDDISMARFNSDGSTDLNFGNGGKVLTAIGNLNDEATSIHLLPDGKILIAGMTENVDTYTDFVLARYNPDGSLDTEFADGGFVATDINGSSDIGNAVAVNKNRKIVVAGTSEGGETHNDFAMVQYHPDGNIDNAFGTNGIVITDFENQENVARGMAIQDDGKIILAGYTYDNTVWSFALVRYLSDLNVGVLDFQSNSNSTMIYPNPIMNEATLEYTLNRDEKLTISLYDVRGGLVKTFVRSELRPKGGHKEILTFGDYILPGDYFLRIENKSGYKSVKLVKY